MIHMDLMKMKQITEVQWQVHMKILTLRTIKRRKFIKKTLENPNQPFGLQFNEL